MVVSPRILVASAVLLGGLLPAVLVAITAAPVVPVDAPAGLRRRATYLHLAPGILAVDVERATLPYYAWGVGGGVSLPFRRAGLLTVGGYFEHLVFLAPPRFRTTEDEGPNDHHFLRFGPELRLGGSSDRVFGYGLLRVGIDLFYDPEPRHELQPAFLSTFGAGVQGLLSRRVVLGAEPAMDLQLLGGSTWFFRARIFVGVLF